MSDGPEGVGPNTHPDVEPRDGQAPAVSPDGASGQGDSAAWGSGTAPAGSRPPSLRGDDPSTPEGDVWQAGWEEESRRGVPVGVRRASFGRRAGAYVLDSVLLLSIYWTMLTMTGAVSGQTVSEKPAIITGLLCGLFQLAYFVGGWVKWRGSPAQRMLGIQIGNEKTGASLSWSDAFVRWGILQGPFALCAILPFAIQLLADICAATWAVALAYTTMNASDGRGLHDRAVSCQVNLD